MAQSHTYTSRGTITCDPLFGITRRRRTRRARYHCKLARMMDADVRRASWKHQKPASNGCECASAEASSSRTRPGWRQELSSTIAQCFNREGAVIDCAFHGFVAADAEPGTRAQYSLSALGSPHAAKRFIGLAIGVRTRSRNLRSPRTRITSHDPCAFRGVLRCFAVVCRPVGAAAGAVVAGLSYLPMVFPSSRMSRLSHAKTLIVRRYRSLGFQIVRLMVRQKNANISRADFLFFFSMNLFNETGSTGTALPSNGGGGRPSRC